MPTANLYETVFVLHPELSEEDVEAAIQEIVRLLERHGASVLRLERGGKRRLAYPIRKQRYGYYNLLHFRALPRGTGRTRAHVPPKRTRAALPHRAL
ncbi:MAG: hypothetical protein KatS3mg131_0858 [Candidatus Tectimicrobiota bacterium]|nr:MAG: hypothetical protein KatS3mg131_0858 [Candidatus Tectomicrobia bacterium]